MTVGEFWPEKYVLKNEWQLNYQQNAPMSTAGRSVAIDHGEPYWTADVTVTVPTDSPHLRLWSSFFARRQGAKNSFTMNRSFQSFPQNPAITTDEGLVLASADRSTSRIVLGTGANRNLGEEGDMFGYFTEAEGYYIGEIAKKIANHTYEMTPPPFQPHPTESNPRRIKPIGEFRLLKAPRPTETNKRRTWSFLATQVIRG